MKFGKWILRLYTPHQHTLEFQCVYVKVGRRHTLQDNVRLCFVHCVRCFTEVLYSSFCRVDLPYLGLAFVCFSFFLATCARLSWSLSFLAHHRSYDHWIGNIVTLIIINCQDIYLLPSDVVKVIDLVCKLREIPLDWCDVDAESRTDTITSPCGRRCLLRRELTI